MKVNVSIHVSGSGKERVVDNTSRETPSLGLKRSKGEKRQGLENWLVDIWWREHMFVPFMQGLQIHQNLMGARAAAFAGESVELDSVAMTADASEKLRVRAYQNAHGNHLHAEKLVRKELSEGLKVGLLKSISEDIIRSYIRDEVDLMGERAAYDLSSSTRAGLKALVYQSELQDLV
ncbi:hypothetical protein A3J17_04740 [Candidatus Curtissbacteria bacterium RIFCSPLOWO2_02_FULL_40_11]|uniref:Uncharacterized protein n=2 Tax=Candidatus Curtissiibacteriota TaxID=1752717 RepID=A0A1F5G823_9BACT|nr:MAG: hypothetical protein A3D04_03025 [Candidatus Curtissbacteria bacterium RIFCSPHIGHO2_02_FULL_40_16b]OGD99690.1 MAG: hypothetical protein A3J17_04740 [Candidatus Curtissbacteria bacterium RIFCSPLOWO2_02_FULL_40_11]OGE13676.1 MAG: hypothetical protein A3G14_04870 [Candidatus Curtissbacteria bacterium RIFCSPLOWO2_12_FULL_38_9]